MTFWDKYKLDSTEVEVTLRIALASGLSYALSVAYVPKIVPQTVGAFSNRDSDLYGMIPF